MLLLFDIDGTLLKQASESHAAALHEALRLVHRVDSRGLWRSVSYAGRTDGEVARLLLLEAGVSAERIDERAEMVRDETCRLYAEMCERDLSDKVVPGMQPVLEWLSGLDGVVLSLVTGNFEAVARLKLNRAGIGGYFSRGQGGFGSDAEDRAALPPIARRRAGAAFGGPPGTSYPRERTAVIGDTPRDIACARADGLRCVAVTTGPYRADELNGADAVATDPGALRSVLESWLSLGRASCM